VVLAVLRNLLIVNGERINYRALEVKQIGTVYEGIMGYAVRRIPGRCIGLKSKPQGAKKQLTTAVDLDALLALPGAKRKAWLEEEAATTLPAKSATALKAPPAKASCWKPWPRASTASCSMGPRPLAAWYSSPPRNGASAAATTHPDR